ncbi:penicillin-binding transpeptidase domain-containing protein [Herbivorax sp. ANBcel31]|uniref:penicillin-binding transpeptidase domain-containing protein n=1 Tax=Herbivorax sp. ANBcel31 TaxID=3069754 RepID=UPI0027B6401F|nr:penicillin-binding transpeptidase domain-containing protein [Herbivorax sp. ANBcel31]MDQ2086883.1 penicillin-binding transpeptidase domain-containing protein [Herbivorax sp. ANBcel31]
MNGATLIMKKRLLFLLVAFSVFILGLLFRVGWIQIVRGAELQEMAFNQQNSNREITPRRGNIYDRNGNELASSLSVEKIAVNPQELPDDKKENIAQKFSIILEMDKEDVLDKLNKDNRYEIIKSHVSKEVGNQVRQFRSENNIRGIYIDEDSKRIYPNNNLAAHVLGFVGQDSQGLEGIENEMENELEGIPGRILSEVDARGRQTPFFEEKRIEPQEGLGVVLTIDKDIQYIATRELERAIDDNKVLNGGTVVVMDPRNGDVLAMVSKPDFDPNDPRACPPGKDPETWDGTTQDDIDELYETVLRNKSVVDTYEPGSTFKAVTVAAGLEEGVVTLDTLTDDKPYEVQGHTIRCWRTPIHGEQTFREAVYNSCNPAFVKVGEKLGISTFYEYVRSFGFYDKTGLPVISEGETNFHENPTQINMATTTFGQRFTITPVHLINAYNAIANGGNLIKPRLVRELRDNDGNIVKKYETEVVRQVISKETSNTMRELFEGVVSEGTGRNAYVKGYRVAGKTGTSETLEDGVYIASFAAFAPADNPVISVLVALDYPTGHSYYGGQIAAPVAGKIVEDTLDYLNIERRYTERDEEMMAEEVFVPDIRDKTVNEAKQTLREFGLEYRIEEGVSGDDLVKDQTPKPGIAVSRQSIVIVYNYTPENKRLVSVPDLTNKTIDEAVRTLNNVGLNIKINGIGSAISQNIEAGEEIQEGEVVEVDFLYRDTD